jgi:hypothetical protein
MVKLGTVTFILLVNIMAQFIGLNRYQIGIPEPGYSYLFVNLSTLTTMGAADALVKLESLGYVPTLRYWDNGETLQVCALLKVATVTADPEADPLMAELETLYEHFDGELSAVRCSTRRPAHPSTS